MNVLKSDLHRYTIKDVIMGAAIIKIIILLLMLILPFAKTKRRRNNENTATDKIELHSNYCVNERGELEEMDKQDIS